MGYDPSDDWDRFCESAEMDPVKEEISNWICNQIETSRMSIKGRIHRRNFFKEEHWGVDLEPEVLADEIAEIIGTSEALREVAYLVAKAAKGK